MLRLALLLPLVGMLFLFQSCNTDPITCIRVSSSQITESRDVRDFKGITLYEHANLVLSQGADYVVKITGPQNVVELTNTTLVDDYLVISSEDCFNGDDELTIEVTAPEFELIYISSMGSLETAGLIAGSNIKVELLGQITGNANFEMDSIFTVAQGKGVLNYFGTASYHEMDVEGEYAFSGFPLITEHTAISLLGLGVCEVTANGRLDVAIEGSGKVYYKGSPDINSDIAGTGQIIDSN